MTEKQDTADTLAEPGAAEANEKNAESKAAPQPTKDNEPADSPNTNVKSPEENKTDDSDVTSGSDKADNAKKDDSAPVAKPKSDKETSVRERIEKEIASKKSGSTAIVPAAIDPNKTATIEAELREKLDKEVSRRQEEKKKSDKEKSEKDKPEKADAKDPKHKKAPADGKDEKASDKGKKGGSGKSGKSGKGDGAKKPRRKRLGSQTRPQLSEREQKILEQKALIDKKLKARNKYIYAAITIVTLIGLFIVARISKRNSAGPAPLPPQTEIKEVETRIVGGSSGPKRQSSTFRAANKEAQKIMASQDYKGAVAFLTNHSEKFPKDKDACDKAIKMINDNFINPVALPPPDPKARWSPAEKRAAKRRAELKRLKREGILPPDATLADLPESDASDFGELEEMTIEDPGLPTGGGPDEVMNDDPFGFDDSGLKEEKVEEKNPLDDLDSLIE